MGLFSKIAAFFTSASVAVKGTVIGVIVVVICGGAATAILLTMDDAQSANGEVSSVSSDITSTSSEAVSSETVSSEETSSEGVSSEVVSSAPVSSAVVSSAPVSSAAVSSVPISSAVVSSAPVSSAAVSSAAVTGLPTGYLEKYADAYSQNPSVVGQIVLPGTNLNYYVAQTTDNSFYIDHNFNKQYYVWGNPYLDYRCSVVESMRYDNIVLYAHSDDKNQLQFAPIKHYKELDFYKNHPTISFNTVYKDETYKVVGFFGENVDQANSFKYWYAENLLFSGEDAFNNFVDEVKSRSFVSMPVDCQYGDRFITLSTCVSTSTKHSRYVLVARRVRSGESTSVDVSAAQMNPNQKAPSGPLN